MNDVKNLNKLAFYIPLRLSPLERSLLTVLESTLSVSEYTDEVDIANNRYGSTGNGGRGMHGKVERILDGILEVCRTATGLTVGGTLDCISSDFNKLGTSTRACEFVMDIDEDDTNGHRNDHFHGNNCDKRSNRNGIKSAKIRKKEARKERKLAERRAATQQEMHESGSIKIKSSIPTNIRESKLNSLTPIENEAFFQTLFEIGRRNKILNPSKMRGTYGKLMHLLQDSQSPCIAKGLGFNLYKDLIMVKPFLESFDCAHLLNDERLVGATEHVLTRDEETGEKIERHIIEAKIAKKKELLKNLLDEYSHDGESKRNDDCIENNDENDVNCKGGEFLIKKSRLSRVDLQRCLDSIADAITVVECNVAPVNRMIKLLTENFQPNSFEKNFSLEISSSSFNFSSPTRYGYGFGAFGSAFGSPRESAGPTLSHSHSMQYIFVYQSLALWSEVQRNMHKLWFYADQDLLSTTITYQLVNTGQGLNRVQACPRVAKVMRNLLGQTQTNVGSPWVGLSVIHLGDRDVPNALVFIDKYTQIPRFLKPIVDFCDSIPELCSDEHIARYVKDQFGDERHLRMTVLIDYFKHGFDGSGDDGGSCIDGRLTSSWNWTSRIAKKNYYHTFMLSGFHGFDGDFK